jgi:hypothetical protein
MLIVSRDLHEFHAVTLLPPRTSFNTSLFIDGNIVPLVEKSFPVGQNAERRKLGMHIDDTPAHNSRMTQNSSGTTRWRGLAFGLLS